MIKHLLLSLLFVPFSAFAKNNFVLGFVPGEVIVRYKKSALKSLNTSRFSKTLSTPQKDTFILKVDQGNVLDAVKTLKKNPNVEHVQPNYRYRLLETPNDTHLDQLWAVENTAQEIGADLIEFGPGISTQTANPGVKGKHMSLLPTWDLVKDCSSTIVAVIDTGVAYDHEDLAANMWDGSADGFNFHGYDTFSNTDDPYDTRGHGTHVAGTIGAIGGNNRGVTGVCWDVQIMAVKVFGDTGEATTQSVIDGINWAVAHGAHIINMSLGGEGADALLEQAVKDASDAGVIVVMAAGNEKNNNDATPMYPCNYRFALTLCVAALDQAYGLASFSNYGKTSVDVGAPGVNILSTWPFAYVSSQSLSLGAWATTATGATSWGSGSSNGFSFLSAPAGWNGRKRYENNTNAVAYQSFASAAQQKRAVVSVLYNLSSGDAYNFYVAPGSANPTTTEPFYTWTGTTGSYAYSYFFDITEICTTANCTLGFQLKTDSFGQNTGVLFYDVKIQNYYSRTYGYNISSGTSMASPQVAGVAALVLSYNNHYTPLEVVNAVKLSGASVSALAGKTVTGRAVNALNAVNYIQPPKNLAATYVPPTPPEDADPGTPEP